MKIIRFKSKEPQQQSIYYIDDTTFALYRKLLLADIESKKVSIKTPSNIRNNKQDILNYVNNVCDNFENYSNELYALAAKIEFIHKYLVKNNIHIVDDDMRTLSHTLNHIFSHKAILFNFPVRHVTFDKIISLLEQHELWLNKFNQKLNDLMNSPKIEIAIIFHMEEQKIEDPASLTRNIFRHALLKYSLRKSKENHPDRIRTILQKLPTCHNSASMLQLLRNDSHFRHGFFGYHPLRNIIIRELVSYSNYLAPKIYV